MTAGMFRCGSNYRLLTARVCRNQCDRMKEGPDITRIAALIGDPARSNMLNALLSGKALTAGELADHAGVLPATASSHLAKLTEAGLIWPRKQGRHKYYALKDERVAHVLESLAGLAAEKGHLRTRTGPADEGLRVSRICYDHLAGAQAVRMFDSMAQRAFFTVDMEEIALTPAGEEFAEAFGIDIAGLRAKRRPLCKVCLDWSERRSHLSGALGAAMLTRFHDLGWARQVEGSRMITFGGDGMVAFEQQFPVL
jgi:DNA-binding transcriptional ArsR family regulator